MPNSSYGLLLDRMSLSIRNDWRDARGRVYIIYTTKGVSEDLGCCQDKACKLMAELERAGLIERRRLGQGKPSRIYVKQLSSEVGKSEFKNTENTNSALDENRILNFDISESNHIEINHTNYIHTNLSSSDTVEDEIKEQLDYPLILEHQPGKRAMLDTIINVIAEAERKASKTLRVNGSDVPKEQSSSHGSDSLILHTLSMCWIVCLRVNQTYIISAPISSPRFIMPQRALTLIMMPRLRTITVYERRAKHPTPLIFNSGTAFTSQLNNYR